MTTTTPTLVIGEKAKSSWSLRPWLLLRHHGVPFREIEIALDQPDSRARILEHSPSGRVPCLLHDDARVWDSLAICEYAAETWKLPAPWPQDRAARGAARAIAAEMHAGFADLRKEFVFDALRAPAVKAPSPAAEADIARVRAIWRELATAHGGPWLFGTRFGIADAMFAPVALRFEAYGVALSGPEAAYARAVREHAAVREWIAEARSKAAREAAPPAG